MYCIKCGKNTKTSDLLCSSCATQSGFGVLQKSQLDKKEKYGMYIGIVGNICMFIGLFFSFLLITPDAPADYVAQLFKEEKIGPVEPTGSEEAQEEDKAAKTEETEVKGYSYSMAEYLMKRDVSADAAEDGELLGEVAEFLDSINVEHLDMDDEEQMKSLEKKFGQSKIDQVKTVLEQYGSINVRGIFIIALSVIAIGISVWMMLKRDFRWGILFSLLATTPVWTLLVKLNGITAWKFENGIYLFVVGILAVLIGSLMGGNTDSCPHCRKILPGGAGFCYNCGKSFLP